MSREDRANSTGDDDFYVPNDSLFEVLKALFQSSLFSFNPAQEDNKRRGMRMMQFESKPAKIEKVEDTDALLGSRMKSQT